MKKSALVLVLPTVVVIACAGDDEPPAEPSTSSSSSSGGSSSSSSSSGGNSSSGSSSGGSSSSSSSGGSSSGVSGVGEPCVFSGNAACEPALRCECEGDQIDCTCQVGPRGTGAYNAPCESGNDCATGWCVSGADAVDGGPSEFFCTKDCAAAEDCVAPLSRCELTTGLCIGPT